MIGSTNEKSLGQFSGEVKQMFMLKGSSSKHSWRVIMRSLILLLMLRISYLSKEPDVEGEALIDFLMGLNDSSHKIMDWNDNLVSPCYSWSHVTCRNGNVISLSLASIGFSGFLSPSITKLKYLSNLDMHNNSISGNLPDYLATMPYLQNLNLADNNFNGSIPTSWGHIFSLKHLVLKGNRLSGTIPDSITNLIGLVELDLSGNDLTGEIPEKLFSVSMFNFTGTRLICGSGFAKPCVSSTLHADRTKKLKLSVIVTSASGGAFIMFSIGVIFAYGYCYLHKLRDETFADVAGEDDSKISFGQVCRFSWRELQLATDNYREANVIGQGGFGKVYKGVLSNNTKVAVKRMLDLNSPGGEAAFLREVQLISVAVHKNLLRLIGFCTTSTERILVYPFMKNLSVAYCLRDLKPGDKVLDWPTRKRIAFGAARGLVYLHEDCNPKIIHRDLKAANILLDDDFEAVLGDFGLAKLVDTNLTHITTQVRGTMGHIAPEYLSTGKSSEKTDVFGYGVTLLELVTGQRAIDLSRLDDEEDVLLIDHIKKLLKEKRLDNIVDKNLESYDAEEVETMIQVAMLCTHSLPEHRPAMREVVSLLEKVNLAERWGEWMVLEETRDQLVSTMSHQFAWAEESTTHDQEAIQLSLAR